MVSPRHRFGLAIALTLTFAAPLVAHASDTPPEGEAATAAGVAAAAPVTPVVSLTADADSFTATWPAVTNAQRYQLRYRLTTATTWITLPAFTQTYVTRVGLAPGDYRVEVRARVAGAWKPWAGTHVVVGTRPGWAFATHAYRVHLTAVAGGTARNDAPAVVPVDFTSLLSGLGHAGVAFDPASLRVVEVDVAGTTIDAAVPFQFDRATDYDATAHAAGELVVLLVGTTAPSATRRFDVYFDAAGSGNAPVAVGQRVVTVTGVTDEGAAAVRFETQIGDWSFDLAGGGFSSLDDVDGNDWISYNATAGAGGTYRGIPNAVHPAGYFHPGKTVMTTTVTRSGPLRATIESSSPGSGYVTRWNVYPTFAEMTMVQASGAYWFLYEGTPGGTLDPDTDTIVRSDGTVIPASGTFVGDLAGEEWAAFTDAATARSLFVAQLQGDAVADSYSPLSGLMTVFGFGRATKPTTLLTRAPETFRVGLVPGTGVGPVTSSVQAVTRPIAVSVVAADERPAS